MPLIIMSTSQVEGVYIQNDNSIEIGKNIYSTGIGESDQKVMAIVSGNEMPASMMACANCHGKCGEGITLQGVDIPDIRRNNHIQRYQIDQSAENVDKFVNSKLKRTISMGVNHEGDNMHNMMPRYKMSLSDMNHLLAYLAVLGEDENCTEK